MTKAYPVRGKQYEEGTLGLVYNFAAVAIRFEVKAVRTRATIVAMRIVAHLRA